MAGLTNKHLNDNIFKEILSQINPEAQLMSWSKVNIKAEGAISGDLAEYENKNSRIIGVVAFKIKYKIPGSEDLQHKMVALKSKVPSEETMKFLMSFANDGQGSRESWETHLTYYGLETSDEREIEMIQINEPNLKSLMPDVYWNLMDKKQGIFAFMMEYFHEEKFMHLNTIDDENAWKEDDVITVLHGMAKMHAVYYNRTELVPKNLQKYLDNKICGDNLTKHMLAMKKIVEETHLDNPTLWKKEHYDLMVGLFPNLSEVFNILKQSPMTLIHNDFSSKNLCLRKQVPDGKHRLCLYDWETTSLGPQQIDIATFLAFVSRPEEVSLVSWRHYIEVYYKRFLVELQLIHPVETNAVPDMQGFVKIFDMCAIERLLNTFGAILGYFCRKVPSVEDSYIRIFSAIANYVQEISGKYTFLKANN